MEIMTALALVSQTINIVKDLREVDKNFDASEFKARLADVTSNLADVKMSLTDAMLELEKKGHEIIRLLEAANRKADLIEMNGFKYEKKLDGTPKGWPVCPVCLEDSLRLYNLASTQGMRGSCQCPKCNAQFLSQRFSYE